jgi:hypothetical protein
LTVPGLYSFAVWSGVEPAEEKRFNTWLHLWPDEVRRNVLPKLRQQKRGCVLVGKAAYQFERTIAISPNDELLMDVKREMTPIFMLQGFTLYRSWKDPQGLTQSNGKRVEPPLFFP